MSAGKPSFLRRLGGFVLFRFVPVLIVLGIAWFSYGIVQAVALRVQEQVEADSRSSVYIQTLTAIAPTLETQTPTNTATSTATDTATATHTPTATDTATNTATATNTPTATITPSETATHTATFTPTNTPQPTNTDTAEPTETETGIAVAAAQIFATNTPRAAVITLPPVNTAVAATAEPTPLIEITNTEPATTVPLIPTNTVLPTATATNTATTIPTATETPTEIATETPRPLPTLLLPSQPDTSAISAPTAIPTQVPVVDRHGYDIVNILLLGGDEEITADNITRTDTMIILSINRTTGTVAMLSLPRDLYVFIPGWTMQRLNLAYVRGEQVGWTDGGFGLMRQTIFYNLGINVHYYALINLSGFKELVDIVGGVDVAVDCAIQDYPLVSAPPPEQAFRATEDGLYTLPVGYYHLQGEGALWYARSRNNSSDFDRGRRQQQILRAIWRQARDTGQLANLPQLWNEGIQIIETNLGFEDMVGLLPIALSLDTNNIEHFTLGRLYHTTPWTPPDGSNVQLPVYDTIRQLLDAFYQPPTDSQLAVEGAQIRVYNGTTNADWDRVAAERLAWGGFIALPAGGADRTDYTETTLIDYTGSTKGSSLNEIASILNVRGENIIISPDPEREVDFEVILGSTYNSCTFGVLAPETGEEG